MRPSHLLLITLLLASSALGQDFRLAPSDSTLGENAERFLDSKRWGAALLWGGLLLSSLIIGVVRARQRRGRT